MNLSYIRFQFSKTLAAALLALTPASHLHAGSVGSDAQALAASGIELPLRNPARVLQPSDEPARPHPSEIVTPEWSAREIQYAQDQCAMMLDDIGVVFRPIEPIREGVCGAPAPIELASVGKDPVITIEPPARVTCALAASLAGWAATVLQPAAMRQLGEPVTEIRNVASYICRNRYNAPDKPVSEHAFANALDMAAFRTVSGKWVTVLESWSKHEPAGSEGTAGVTVSSPGTPGVAQAAPADNSDPTQNNIQLESASPHLTAQAEFLKQIHAGGCAMFSTALGPEANEAHKDHFHFDLAQRNHGNFCE